MLVSNATKQRTIPPSWKGVLAWLQGVLSFQQDSPALVQAQYRAWSTQCLLLYTVLLTNIWLLAYTYFSHAPGWLVLYIPSALTVPCVLRMVMWWRARSRTPSAEQMRAALVQATVVLWVIAPLGMVWGWALQDYGDRYMQSQIIFCMAMTVVCAMLCLTQIRQAVLSMTLLANMTCLVYFITADTLVPTTFAIAINVSLITFTLLWMLLHQYNDFAELIHTRQHAEHLASENLRRAHRDSLTQLPNRREFFLALDALCEQARGRGMRFAVAIMDLDGFKAVNDLHGHALGDQLLEQVGQRLQSLLQSRGTVARLGGDEFALLINDATGDAPDFISFGQQVCDGLSAPFQIGSTALQVTASMGLVIYPHLASSATDLYQCADYALCQGKRNSRGMVSLFSRQHRERIQRDATIQQTLRTTQLEDELSVVFQPIVHAGHGCTIAFEALARWHSPTLGFVSPGEFIPVAERCGLVAPLTEALLKKSLQALATWPESVRLSFNLSVHDLISPAAMQRILDMLLRSGITPSRIDLEVTETAATHDVEQMQRVISTLRSRGYGVALDDLGTGFSSLSQLLSLPLSKIKVDRSFIMSIDRNPVSRKIVSALLTLSRDMGLECVLEGVETPAERSTLMELGGMLMQGYVYAKPLPGDQVTAWLQTHPAPTSS